MSQADAFPSLTVIDHPLIQHKLTIMRDKDTPPILFRQLLREIGLLMGFEVMRDLPTVQKSIVTPVAPMEAPELSQPVTIASILRAGLGMAEGIRELIPSSREGHIGLYRDPETKQPKEYFVKLPRELGKIVLVDPMLATGGSAAHAVDVLLDKGAKPEDISMVILVAAPEGVETFAKTHPNVRIFTAALDDCLNDHAYIVPGLGDAGDRIFGTL
ncbi:uracil phosphoribosyltransferase [Rhodovibrionaceae bacterium A322]